MATNSVSLAPCRQSNSSSKRPGIPRGARERPSPPSARGPAALVENPHALWQSSGLPEHVDRNAAARIPVAADAQKFRLDLGGDALADHDRAIFMERAASPPARDGQ